MPPATLDLAALAGSLLRPVLDRLDGILAEAREQTELLRCQGAVPATVSVSEAATLLGCSPQSVRAWIGEDRFPGVSKTYGRGNKRPTYRIPLADVIAERGKQVADAAVDQAA